MPTYKVLLVCDRCGIEWKGLDDYMGSGPPLTTGGFRFYNQDGEPSIWNRFAQGIEDIICYRCMWRDETYLEAYPWMKNKTTQALIMGKY